MIQVREASATEQSEAASVSYQAFATTRNIYKIKPDVVAATNANHDTLTRLVAVDDGNIVGTVKYRINRRRLHIIGLGVLPDKRRQGVARCLIDELFRLAASHDCSVMSLFTIKQTGNVAVFERLGFSAVREEFDTLAVSWTGGPLIDVYMERPIVAKFLCVRSLLFSLTIFKISTFNNERHFNGYFTETVLRSDKRIL